jgi:hypothetical protein
MLRTVPRIVPLLVVLLLPLGAAAQPTYKLDVKPELKPQATLNLDGDHFLRTSLQDDPGFRLQWHFKKDDKTVTTVEGRSSTIVNLPDRSAGTYTVVLELFYPNYKGGTQQKGEFKPVSNVLTFRVEPGAKPDDPVKVIVVESPTKP